MRRFVIGDIHGAHRALVQCFERAGFDKQNDLLISLGDLCDGWPEVRQVFEELSGVRKLISILGNHDKWLLDWFRTGHAPDIWLMQGGDTTLRSIGKPFPENYKGMLEKAKLYYEMENMLFVHGGILTGIPLEKQNSDVFLWDRSLVTSVLTHRKAMQEVRLTPFKMVYLGHTPTIRFGNPEPIISCGVCILDTGAGWPGGKLTISDIDNGKFYASDLVDELYPNFKGR